MKKLIAFMLCAAVLLPLTACGNVPERSEPAAREEVCGVPTVPAGEETQPDDGAEPKLSFATDYSEIFETISSRLSNDGYRGMDFAEDEAAVEEPASDGEGGTANSGDGHSGTNVQVEGIDEGDIVKTDGEYIYILSEYELVIVKADGAASAVISRTALGQPYESEKTENADGSVSYFSGGKTPSELYIHGDRLALISNVSSCREYMSAEGDWRCETEQYSSVDFYDISDPSVPGLLSSLGQDGRVIGTRLHEGRLYIVSSHCVWDTGDEERPEDYIPRLYTDGSSELVEAGDICICPYGDSTEYVIVAAYEPITGELLGAQSVLGAGTSVYMRGDSIYVAGTVYDEGDGEPYAEEVYEVVDYHHSTNTALYRFSAAESVSLQAQGLVPGYIESQFSIDEYGGYARMVTTRNEYSYSIYTDSERGFVNYVWHEDESRTNGLYILDSGLNIVGSVENLAEGERVYSARFDGDIAYFCTFEQVDPLFAVDISAPTAPKVLSELKISGFSEYLHTWTQGRLFGFGYEADEETGWTQCLKMVMFDTSDKTDVGVAASHVLTDCWYSEALHDHHAFFIEPEKNIIGFHGAGDYYIYGYDETLGFFRRGHVVFDDWEYAVRAMYIGENVYIVGRQHVYILSLSDFLTERKMDI